MTRPVPCPSCSQLVMRHPSIVSNRVVCPNSRCQITFCWLCLSSLEQQGRQRKVADHFDSGNYRGCPDYEFLDVRNDPADDSSIDMCLLKCKRLGLIVSMPWVNIYFSIRYFFVELYRWLNFKRLCLLKVVVFLVLIPFVLVLGFLYGLLIDCPLSLCA